MAKLARDKSHLQVSSPGVFLLYPLQDARMHAAAPPHRSGTCLVNTLFRKSMRLDLRTNNSSFENISDSGDERSGETHCT
eukprot:g67299.t1